MHLLKRSAIFQIALFTFFLFLGATYILRQIIQESTLYTIIEITFLALVFLGGIVCVLKTKKDDYLVVDKALLNLVKFALYGVSLGLVIGLLGGVFVEYRQYFIIIAGSIMSLSSLFGLYLSIKIVTYDEE